jgi:hypothetical protein
MQPRAKLETELLEMLGLRLRTYMPAEQIDHPALWMSALCSSLRQAIRNGDKVSISIACELIDRDPMLPFGKLVKSSLARELRRRVSSLLPSERVQIVNATMRLLALPFAPREVEDYAKLLSKLPRGEYLNQLTQIEAKNSKALHLKAVLLAE